MASFSWKDALHYGGAGAVALIGVAGSLGVHIPGVTIDPTTCFLFAATAFGAGLKGGWTSGAPTPVSPTTVANRQQGGARS